MRSMEEYLSIMHSLLSFTRLPSWKKILPSSQATDLRFFSLEFPLLSPHSLPVADFLISFSEMFEFLFLVLIVFIFLISSSLESLVSGLLVFSVLCT